MQFYILDPDPAKNASLLPVSMLRTNVREGWRILSDIGHIHGVTWPHQSKPYSLSHAKTLSFCSTRKAFVAFVRYYSSCAVQFTYLGLKGPWGDWFFQEVGFGKALEDIPALLKTETPEKQTARYILTHKSSLLTPDEREGVEGVLHAG